MDYRMPKLDGQRFPIRNGNLFTVMLLITKSNQFNQTILGFIVIAAILVGIQSYDSMENNIVVVTIDWIVLGVFAFEVVAKVLAEGKKPWRYFTGPERGWNTFDFAIVLFCMPFIPVNSGSIAFLRLMRLMRVTKLFKRIPELRVIVVGMVLGMKSIAYIMILLCLAFYLYAVLAVFMFRDNDPGHFMGLGITVITLFRCSTLDDWTDVMYINMLGCDVYDSGLYYPADSTESFTTVIGTYQEFTCVSPYGQWALSALFFLSFTIISAFVVLSLFIGAITLSMSEVLDEQNKERKRAKIAATVSQEWLLDTMHKALSDRKIGKDDLQNTTNPKDMMKRPRQRSKLKKTMTNLASTFGIIDDQEQPLTFSAVYFRFSLFCKSVTEHPKFETLMLFTICTAGVLVGVSTALPEDDCTLCPADNTILAIFTLEVVMKIFAEGRKPLRYFTDPWNRFDFVIVFSSYLPWLLGADDIRAMISILRLLRILRVLKLVSKFKQLKIVVEALLKGFSSISYITMMMLVLFFMFAIVGMILFKDNDPWHFGLLQDAMITLFRCATLEDWTDVMYINMWGCDRYGYGSMPELCTDPFAWGWLATVYFMTFAVIGSLVLVTLFLGVVTTSMEQASIRQRQEDDLQEQIKMAVEKHRITDYGVRILYNAFSLLDEDEGGTLEVDELMPMFTAVIAEYNDFNFHAFVRQVDEDHSGEIDFAEFLHLMILINQWLQDHEIDLGPRTGTLKSLRDSIGRISATMKDMVISPAGSNLKTRKKSGFSLIELKQGSKGSSCSSSLGMDMVDASNASERKDTSLDGFTEKMSTKELSSCTPRIMVVDHPPVYKDGKRPMLIPKDNATMISRSSSNITSPETTLLETTSVKDLGEENQILSRSGQGQVSSERNQNQTLEEFDAEAEINSQIALLMKIMECLQAQKLEMQATLSSNKALVKVSGVDLLKHASRANSLRRRKRLNKVHCELPKEMNPSTSWKKNIGCQLEQIFNELSKPNEIKSIQEPSEQGTSQEPAVIESQEDIQTMHIV